ncbi:MAG: Crp/Fnr family transcriptional regulator [Acidobacteria bacterium]|nr:Crp/Fnr family transcriptional regulator [Acidobacteriota bacterium]
MSPQTIELIANVELFSGLDQDELRSIAQLVHVRHIEREGKIFDAGDRADAVYIVSKGKVNIVITSPDGKELILAVLGEGQIFGEMGLLEAAPRSASVVAATQVELLSISRSDFDQLLDQHPRISRKLLAVISQRLRRANAKMESLAYMDVAGRLARYFLDLARDHGQKLGNGWVVVRRPTHSEIAHSIGTSRETVSRLINDFEERLGMANQGRFTYIREDLLS